MSGQYQGLARISLAGATLYHADDLGVIILSHDDTPIPALLINARDKAGKRHRLLITLSDEARYSITSGCLQYERHEHTGKLDGIIDQVNVANQVDDIDEQQPE